MVFLRPLGPPDAILRPMAMHVTIAMVDDLAPTDITQYIVNKVAAIGYDMGIKAGLELALTEHFPTRAFRAECDGELLQFLRVAQLELQLVGITYRGADAALLQDGEGPTEGRCELELQRLRVFLGALDDIVQLQPQLLGPLELLLPSLAERLRTLLQFVHLPRHEGHLRYRLWYHCVTFYL